MIGTSSSHVTTSFHFSWLRLFLPVALVVVFSPAGVRADLADEIRMAEKQLDLLQSKADLIRHEYLQFQDSGTAKQSFESLLNDGQALMLLKDYIRAAIVFYDLVENDKYRNHLSYGDAVFSLGEALFFNRNFINARTYYRWILEEERGRPFRKLALIRLMQIALSNENFAMVDEVYGQLVKTSPSLSPEVQYLWGKTLFLRRRYEEAGRAFSSITPGNLFFFQARYFLGVVLINQGRMEDALDLFSSLVRQPPRRQQEKIVVELGHLARGRLLHDLGKEPEALDAYQSIEHTSPYFDDSLFEICWTYIQRAERTEQLGERDKWLLEALRTLEILEVSTPNSTLVPQANLLKGHILGKMGRYDDAASAFIEVSHTYATVKQELDKLITQHDDPVRYFNEVVGKSLESFDLSSYLPPLAVKWMSSQDEMATALGVVKGIETGRQFISEARNSLAKLNTLLLDKDRINLFPAIREGAKRTFEAENARVILERNLSQLEERIVMEYVSAEERGAMESARQERDRLEKLVNKLPTTKKDYDDRESRIRQKIESLEKAVYESSIGLKGMKAQLSAMEEWIRNQGAELAGRDEAVRDFREEIRRGWATANQLQIELDQLSNLLATEKVRAGLDREILSGEEDLRKRYSEALRKERDLAEQIHGRLGPEGTAQIKRINDLRLQVDRLRRKLVQISRDLEVRVAEQAEKLKVQALEEEKHLNLFEDALAKLERESENIAGEVAYRALEEVRQKFYQLVMDADVGVLDVAWTRKQEKTQSITELGRRLGVERKRLHEEFKSVLKEVQ